MPQQGDMWFRIMFDHRQAVAGMKLTSRELQEMRLLSADLAGKGLSKLVPQFDKLTRLARVDGDQMKIVAASYGQLALQSREALVASRRFAQHLIIEADVLRKRAAAGEKLTVGEQQRLTQNERISFAFQEGIDEARSARAKELLDVRKRKNEERELRKGKEFFDYVQRHKTAADKKYLANVKYNSQVIEDIARKEAKEKTEAHRKYIVDVKHASKIMEEQRQQQLRQGQAFFARVQKHRTDAINKEKIAIRERNQAERENFQARQAGLALVRRGVSAQRRNVQQQRELRDAFRAGSITAKEYAASIRRLRRELVQLRNPTVENVSQLDAMRSQLFAIAKNIGFITAAYRAYGFAISSVTAAMEQQRSQKAFEVFTGSQAIAKQLISDVRAFAGRTPLTFAASQQSVRTLLQYGVATSKVTTVLEQLGDVSGGSTEQLQRLSLAFGQITANGRLQGQELRQLIEAGFNPLSVIAEQTGKSMFQLKTEMAAGAVSADMIADALQSATSEGGRFNNMLDQIGKTPFGQIQILRGEIQKLQADMGATPAFIGGRTADVISRILQSARAQLKVIAMAGEDATFYADLLTRSFENTNPILKGLAFALRSMAAAEQSFYDTRVEAEERERDARKEALQDQAVEEIQALKIGRIYAKFGREEVERVRLLIQLRRNGLEEEAKALELAAQQADEQERRLNAIKEASKEAQNAERAAKARRDALVRQHEDPVVGLERELTDLFRMEKMGMFADAPGVVRAERERLTKEFIDAKVKELGDSQREAADVATKGSKEEFNIMRDIAMKNADTADKREEIRHKARLDALEAVKTALDNLPADLSEFFPVPVGF